MAPKSASTKTTGVKPTTHVPLVVRWKNFRSFEDTGPIVVKPITVVIGANNIGKSSLIAPLLLLKQTLASRDLTQALVLKGKAIDVGSCSEVIFNHDTSRTLRFELDFHTHDPAAAPHPLKEIGSYPPGGLAIEFKVHGQALQLVLFEVSDIYGRKYLSHRRRPGAAKFQLTLATRSRLEKRMQPAIDGVPRHFMFDSREALASTLKPARNHSNKHVAFRVKDKITLSDQLMEYVTVLAVVEDEISSLLSDTVYIGPLRADAKRAYILSGDSPTEVGTAGEATAEVLFRRQQDLAFVGSVEAWIRKFGFGNKIKFSEATGTFQLHIRDGARWVNYADTGSGVAQVLPILVQGLSMRSGNLVLAQPEIHLNPKLQVVLADFLRAVSQGGIRTIIETHSEHFLLKVRQFIADRSLESDNVSLIFVEKTRGEAKVRHVPIDTVGHIKPSDWPADFMDDSLKAALDLAAAQMRRRAPASTP